MASSNSDPYFGQLNASKKIYTASTEGIIQAPVDQVWKLYRNFTQMDTWWKDFYGSVTAEPSGSPPDKVGVIRSFNTLSGRSYKEKLLELDEDEYRLVYSYESGEPDILEGAVTTVDFDKMDENQTRVVWGSQFQPKNPIMAERISAGQKSAYDHGIRQLQLHFKPATGLLTIVFTGGKITQGDGDYLLVSANGESTQRVRLSYRGTPTSGTKLEFPITSLEGKVQVVAMDARFLSDRELGTASVPISQISEQKNVEFEIRNRQGSTVGKMEASVEISGDLKPTPPSPEEVIGRTALAVGRDLLGRVVEISLEMGEDERDQDPNTPYKYASYAEQFGPLPKFCKILPAREVIMPKRTGEFFQRNNEYIYAQVPLLQAARDPNLMAKLMGPDRYNHFFRYWVQEPEKVIERYALDEELTAQLLRGVNPVKIQLAKEKNEIPSKFHGLKDDQGRGVDDLIKAKSLFYCDYWELMVGDYNEEEGYYSHQAINPTIGAPMGERKYWYAPILVTYKNRNGKLGILGIQLTRHKNKENEIYRADTHPKNVYQLCKYHLSCADNQHHQFATHLGLGHLLMEPFSVAANNAFPRNPPEKRHPIGQLLNDHFQDTIGINFLARQTLVSEVAPLTDATFSPGTGNGLRIFSNAYQKWDLIGDNFPNSLKKRGFDEQKSDGLEGYYYREDGFKVWNAFKNHFTSMIDGLYSSDTAVARDATLVKWCNEMRAPDRGAIETFPEKIESKEQLVEVVTSIVYQCSAFHASVNFPQKDYVAVVRNRPDAMLKPMLPTPTDGSDIDIRVVEEALPSIANAEFQVLFAHLLTTPPDNPFKFYKALEDKFPEKCEAFRKDLERLHVEITERNQKLRDAGEIDYPYLDPYELPQSINI